VSFHFDPLIPHKDWREGYLRTIDLMDRYLKPTGIIWISMGSLRFMPDLKPIIRKRHPENRDSGRRIHHGTGRQGTLF
jgi:spore photoproduct lyase